MMSIMTFSSTERRALAPVPLSMAIATTLSRASSVNSSSTPSISKRRLYCFTSAFFGSTRMFLRADESSGSRTDMTGRRPMNSGMSP